MDGYVYMSGSKEGKTNQVARAFVGRTKSSSAQFENLPDMLFGRSGHSMIILDNKYLYVFGGLLTR